MNGAATDTATITSVFDRSLRPIMLSTLAAVSLAAFDGLGVTAAQNAIASDLGRVGLLSWIFAGFSLTLTIAAVAAGPLIDSLGLRRVYRATLVGFLAASVLCCIAPTMETLIAARILQGIGGGLIVAVALTAIGIVVPEHLRSRAFALNATIWGVMSFGGPALAALLLRVFGWRAVFAVNIPLTLFAALIGWHRLPGPSDTATRHSFDVRGLAYIGVFASALLIGTAELNRWTMVAVGVAAIAAAIAWRASARTANPVLARHYLNAPPIALINWIVFTIFAGGLSVETFVPLFVKGGLGHSDQAGAFSVAFMSLGWTSASIVVSTVFGRARETTVMLCAMLLTTVPLTIGLLTYGPTTPLLLVAANSFVQGAGIGATTNVGLTYLQRLTPPDEMGRANAAHQFLRNLGTTIGVAAAGAVMFAVVRRRLGSLGPIQPLLKGNHDIAVSRDAREALALGYRWAHVLAVSLIAVGVGLTLRLRAYDDHAALRGRNA